MPEEGTPDGGGTTPSGPESGDYGEVPDYGD